MPDDLRAVADFTPMGAVAEAMTAAWDGGWPSALHLIVMAAWAVGATAVAARVFRWE
jgi:ABC-2 type transport system permease protein